jgi:vacuolar-type H+-ATPase subunit C/Vma6
VLREYEYRNLLTLLREKFSDVQNIRLWDIGKYGRLPSDVERDFPRSLTKTPFEKYIARMDKMPLFELEFEIDKQYYEELNACVNILPKNERDMVRPLLETEILLQNLLWALRLRFYFKMSFDEVEKLLFPLGFAAVRNQVRLLFELPLDAPKEWNRLRCGDIFTAERDGVIDPEAIEGRAIHYLYKKNRRYFYMFPFTLASVYAFFRIKTYEARLITSISEGIRMGMSAGELAELIGVV